MCRVVSEGLLSYDRKDEETKTWVHTLCKQLRSHGVDALYDGWGLKRGDDIDLYLQERVVQSDMVMMVCTPGFKDQFDARSGRMLEARRHFEQALAMHRQVYGTDAHTEVAATLHQLAKVHARDGDRATALELRTQALAIEEAVYRDTPHHAVAISLHNLGDLRFEMGDLAGARSDLERSWKMMQTVFADDAHPLVVKTKDYLQTVLDAITAGGGGKAPDADSTANRLGAETSEASED